MALILKIFLIASFWSSTTYSAPCFKKEDFEMLLKNMLGIISTSIDLAPNEQNKNFARLALKILAKSVVEETIAEKTQRLIEDGKLKSELERIKMLKTSGGYTIPGE